MSDILEAPRKGATGEKLFESFWMGGFEASTHINRFGQRLDMIAATHHDRLAQTDYALLRAAGLKTSRDALRWHLIEKRPGEYDFSSLSPLVEAARENGVDVIWTLCHYGYPDWLDIFSPDFVLRFADFSHAAAKYLKARTNGRLLFAPLNEISFFAWAGTRLVMSPFAQDRDMDLKRQLVRAAIASLEAILPVAPRARFVFPEPIIHVVTPPGRTDLESAAASHNESQYEAWDMIAGHKEPELGGNPKYLDIVGMNYYHSNQWEIFGDRLKWEQVPRDPRWRPLREMMAEVWNRYRRPVFLSETSHFGVGRAAWIEEIGSEVLAAIEAGVPVEGICLYPIVDRYDWEDPNHWHNSGLFDLRVQDQSFQREWNPPYGDALRILQAGFRAKSII